MRLTTVAYSFPLLALAVGIFFNFFAAASSQTTEECRSVPSNCASLLPYTSRSLTPFFPLSDYGMQFPDVIEGAFQLSTICMTNFGREACALRYPPCPGLGRSSQQVCQHRCRLLIEACSFLAFTMEIDCGELTFTQEAPSGFCTSDTSPLGSTVNSTTQETSTVTQYGNPESTASTKLTDLAHTRAYELEGDHVSPSSTVDGNIRDTYAPTTAAPVEASTLPDADIDSDVQCQPVPSNCALLLSYNSSSLAPLFPLSDHGEVLPDVIEAVFQFKPECMRDFGVEVCSLLHPPCPTEQVKPQMCAHRCPLLTECCGYFLFLVNVDCSQLTLVQEGPSGLCTDDTYSTASRPTAEATQFRQTTLGVSAPEETTVTLMISTKELDVARTTHYPQTIIEREVERSTVLHLGTRVESITPISTDASVVFDTTLGTSFEHHTAGDTASLASLSDSTSLVEEIFSPTTGISDSGTTIVDTNLEVDTELPPFSTDIVSVVKTYPLTTELSKSGTTELEITTGMSGYGTTIVETETDIDTSYPLSTDTPTVRKTSSLSTELSGQITTTLEPLTEFDRVSLISGNTVLTTGTPNNEITELGVPTWVSSPPSSTPGHDSAESPSTPTRVPSTAGALSSTEKLKTEILTEKAPVTIQPNVFEEELMDITMILASPNVTTEEVREAVEKVVEISSDDAFISEDPARVELVISSLESIVDTGYTENVTEPVIEIIDNLMDVDEEVISQGTSGGGRAVAALEELVTNVQENEGNVTIIRQNLGVVAVKVNSENIGDDLVFTVAGRDADNGPKQDGEETFVTRLYANEEEIPIELVMKSTRISVPREVIDSTREDEANSTTVPVSFIIYGNSRLFTPSMPSTNYTPEEQEDVSEVIASQIISARVEGAPSEQLALASPIIAEFLLNAGFELNESTTKHCVLWDYDEDTHEGFWSTERCRMISDEGNHTVCSCDRFASFAILVRVDNGDIVLYYITFVGSIVSGICLILCILTFISLRSLRTKQPTHIHINLCVSLLGFYVSFMLSIPATRDATLCKVASAAIHFFSLATIAWMTAEAVNMYFLFVKMERRGIKYFMPIASLLTYGFSAICVVLTIFLDNNSQFERASYCFIQPGNALYFGFLTQVAVLFAINFFIFIWVIRKMLCRPLLVTKTNKNARRNEIITRVRHGILFWFILGLSWFFGFLSAITVDSKTIVFDYLYCIFTSLQGLVMFLLLCVANPEFRKVFMQLRKTDVSRSDSGNMTGSLAKTRRTSDGHLTSTANSQAMESSHTEGSSGASASESG